ncbi:hypothetical protein Lal_00031999 [Lupinus albus]|nr:hypothetical protein Lal_00031999 [Lupinus albus]
MSSPKRQRIASHSYPGFDNSSVISNSLFGFRDPYYASNLKLARFIVLDEDLLVDVARLARFDHQYGHFEGKKLNSFEPVKVYKSMLRDSQQYIHFHLDIYKYDGVWTYFEDVDFYPVSNELPPPVDDSDEDTIVHPVHYHALDEVEDVEDDPEEDSDDK